MLPEFITTLPQAVFESFLFSICIWALYIPIRQELFKRAKYCLALYLALTALSLISIHWIYCLTEGQDSATKAEYPFAFIKTATTNFINQSVLNIQLESILGLGILIIYILLVVWKTVLFIKNASQLYQIRGLSYQPLGGSASSALIKAASKLQLRTIPAVKCIQQQIGPLTINMIKPIIFYPIAAVNGLAYEEIESILMHELVHIKRKDFYINLYTQILRIIICINPWARIFAREIKLQQEIVCDYEVLKHHTKSTYSNALVKVAQNVSLPLAMNAQRDLYKRIQIMYGEKRTIMHTYIKQLCSASLVLSILYFAIPPNTDTYKTQPTLELKHASTFRSSHFDYPHIIDKRIPSKTRAKTSTKKGRLNTTSDKKELSTIKPGNYKKATHYEEIANLLSKETQQASSGSEKASSSISYRQNNYQLSPASTIKEEKAYRKELILQITKGTEWIIHNPYYTLFDSKLEFLTPEEFTLIAEEMQEKMAQIQFNIEQRLQNQYTTKRLESLANQVKIRILKLLYIQNQEESLPN